MVICFRRDRTFVDSLPYIYMNGNYIERVSQAKVLVVTISSDLSWKAHVDEIILDDLSIETCWYQQK